MTTLRKPILRRSEDLAYETLCLEAVTAFDRENDPPIIDPPLADSDGDYDDDDDSTATYDSFYQLDDREAKGIGAAAVKIPSMNGGDAIGFAKASVVSEPEGLLLLNISAVKKVDVDTTVQSLDCDCSFDVRGLSEERSTVEEATGGSKATAASRWVDFGQQFPNEEPPLLGIKRLVSLDETTAFPPTAFPDSPEVSPTRLDESSATWAVPDVGNAALVLVREIENLRSRLAALEAMLVNGAGDGNTCARVSKSADGVSSSESSSSRSDESRDPAQDIAFVIEGNLSEILQQDESKNLVVESRRPAKGVGRFKRLFRSVLKKKKETSVAEV